MKIIFMGTPDFAVGILDKLVNEKQEVIAVITAPDKPSGRGLQLSESAVKKYALENNLNVLQPTNLKDENFIIELKSLEADLFVVVAFRMLPEIVWTMPPKGTINLHASLLPQYRGAAPINWAIINGEKQTGVTTFFIEKEIDTGMVIERDTINIEKDDTAGDLHDKLMELGKRLVFSSVQKIAKGEVTRTPQEDLTKKQELLSAPKIFKPMCEIDWKKSVQQIHNHCRGLSPYPTAWTILEDENGNKKSCKIFKTKITDKESKGQTKAICSKNEMLLPCSDYYISIQELQLEGKKRMQIGDFLMGYGNFGWKIDNKS